MLNNYSFIRTCFVVMLNNLSSFYFIYYAYLLFYNLLCNSDVYIELNFLICIFFKVYIISTCILVF
jgi:hypothetical protein